MHDVLTVSCTTVQVDILSTISNVADGLYLVDTRRHETHDSGKREDDPRGFRSAETSRRETVARCRDDKFRDRARSSEDRGEANAGAKTPLKIYCVELRIEFICNFFLPHRKIQSGSQAFANAVDAAFGVPRVHLLRMASRLQAPKQWPEP